MTPKLAAEIKRVIEKDEPLTKQFNRWLANFGIDQVEYDRIIAFKNLHLKTCEARGMSPGLFTYSYTPTTIATFIEIQCTSCESRTNVTNLDVI